MSSTPSSSGAPPAAPAKASPSPKRGKAPLKADIPEPLSPQRQAEINAASPRHEERPSDTKETMCYVDSQVCEGPAV